MEIIVTIKIEGDETLKVENSCKDKGDVISNPSMYARFYDESNPNWNKDPHWNLVFLRQQEIYANDLLKVKGHLFLNDVYSMLGIPTSKIGQVVGWIYEENNPVGDNFIDFGVYNENNTKFVNGEKNTALLDFNVDGMILDRI